MPHPRFSRLFTILVAATFTLLSTGPVGAAERKSFDVCWTIYAGWMPWGHGSESGIIKKWADKYNISINLTQINDYIESINQFTAGKYDACTMTNMDALTIPAASGVDTTVLVVNDFSNGNDGLVLKGAGKNDIKAIRGQKVNLVELSVSHYVLARALEKAGMSERDVKVINTSDADIVAAYSTEGVTAVATWNPMLAQIVGQPHSHLVFDSTQIPGEIIDLLAVNTETLKRHPEFGKALTGAWYEIMAVMQGSGAQSEAALQSMAAASGTDLAGYKSQLEKTTMFYDPVKAVEFVQSEQLPVTMRYVAEFSFDHGLLGEGASDPTFIGIETPSGVYGDKKNIRLRFDPAYMAMAAEKKL